MPDRLKSPVSGRDGCARCARPELRRALGHADGPRYTQVNPLSQDCHGRLGKLAGRWHFQLGMSVADGLDQQAFISLGRNGSRPRITPLENGFAAIEPQARRLLLRAMALHAVVDQDRPDPRLKEFNGGRWKRIAVDRTGFRAIGPGQVGPRTRSEDNPGQTKSKSDPRDD